MLYSLYSIRFRKQINFLVLLMPAEIVIHFSNFKAKFSKGIFACYFNDCTFWQLKTICNVPETQLIEDLVNYAEKKRYKKITKISKKKS